MIKHLCISSLQLQIYKVTRTGGLYTLNSDEPFLCLLVALHQVIHFSTAAKFTFTNYTFRKIFHASVCTKQQNQLMFFYTYLVRENWQQRTNMCDNCP